MKKTHSLNFQLILSTSFSFVLFVVVMVSSALSLYSKNVTNLINDQIHLSCREVLSNYETYFASVISISNSIQTKCDNIDLPSNTTKVQSFLDDILLIKDEVTNLSLYTIEGKQIVADSKSLSTVEVKKEDWFVKAKENKIINVFSRVNVIDDKYAFVLSKFITYDNGLNSSILKITCDFTNIIKLIGQTNFGEGGHISIYDKEYNTVYTSSTESIEDETKTIKKLVLGETSYKTENNSYLLFVSTLANTTWRVAMFTNNDSIGNVVNTFLTIISTSAAAIAVLFVLVLILIGNSITSPIRQLQREMVKVENLNYQTTINSNIGGSKEVVDLTNSYNQMMARIKELATKIISEQEEQRKSELKALQNQINPHFLYNTLDSIIFLIDKNENEKAEKMIMALSKFFRISISRGKSIIPLEKEIEHAENYLLIQKLRFGDNFNYTINVDKDLYNYYVIKLILQPIVENAIAHGLKEYEGVGEININGYLKDDLICLEVIDNGYGMLPQKIEEIYNSFKDNTVHNGVGLKNVYQRIKIYYGEKADIKISTELDVGTTITIFIPIEGALKNEE